MSILFVVAAACGGSQPDPMPPSDPAPTDPVVDPAPPPAAGGCVPQGCSNTVCAEEGAGIITTCEYKAEYACYQSAVCERQPGGECGWTETAELSACLASPPPLE